MTATTTATHDWQSLVELSGLLVSEPVLREYMPEGPDPLPDWLSRKFRREYARWQSAQDRRKSDPERAARYEKRWINFILSDILGYGERIHGKRAMPPNIRIDLTNYMQRLEPDKFIVDEQGRPQILVYTADGGLDTPEQRTGRWKASPFTKLDRLLRDTRVQLGILTNGTDWRLVYAAPGLPTSYITWTATGWDDERATLNAFRMVLHDPAQLLKMASESQQRQADVTDKLGNQVLSALSIFVRQLDDFDKRHDGDIFAGMSDQDIYEVALFVMMRLVFIFYAEENNLLPHGEVFYDEAYGLTYLWNQLEKERRLDDEAFGQREDAFPRLLATFRLIHAGCTHPDFSMRAYGGALFDPQRFPMLEDKRLRIKNRAIWRMLRKLTTATGDDNIRQRVSYRSLQVEQLGYVYENLLGYTIKVADEPMLQPDGAFEAFPQSSFADALRENGEDGLYEYYKGINDLHWTQTRKYAEEAHQRYTENPSDMRWILQPLMDTFIDTGQRYVSFQMGTRKRGGIFYTPPQLTRFLVEQALKPKVYHDPDNESGIGMPQHILNLTVCDPAMGSGAFLVQAVRYLGERLVESWDAFRPDDSDSNGAGQGQVIVMPYAEPEASATENTGVIPDDDEAKRVAAYRLIAERCIYGVDLNHLAVELAKLSLWLVTLSKDEPFTFLDHRLRHGNSLIGASFFAETTVDLRKRYAREYEAVGTVEQIRRIEFIPDEALKPRKGASTSSKKESRSRIKGNQQAQTAIAAGQIGLFGNFSVTEALETIRNQRRELDAPTDTADTYTRKRHLLTQVLQAGGYRQLQEVADLWCAVWFWQADSTHGLPPTTGEYHDTVKTIIDEVDTDLFGDSTLTTTPARIAQIRRTAQTIAQREHFFHWELQFPRPFLRQFPGFDALVGNPPWETVEPNSLEFFEAYDPEFRTYGKQQANRVMNKLMQNDPEIAAAWDAYINSIESQANFYNSEVNYKYQGRGKAYTYQLFTEQAHHLMRSEGSMSVVVPAGVYKDYGSMEIRDMLLSQGTIDYIFAFSNVKKFFPNVNDRVQFALIGARKSVYSEGFYVTFRFNPRVGVSPEQLIDFLGDESNIVYIKRDSIHQFSPDTLSIMEFQSQIDYDTTQRIYENSPILNEKLGDTWNMQFTQEFNMTSDSKLLNEEGIGIPLYEGKMIHQYNPHFAEPRYWIDDESLDSLPEGLQKQLSAARLAHRRIARPTDERTFIASFVPPNVGCEVNCTVIQVEGTKAEEMFLCAIANSLTLDYVLRQKVASTLNMFYMYQLPVPRLQEGNPFFDELVPRAARLTCTTADFADLWRDVMGSSWDASHAATDDARQHLRHEIDALVAHLYGLSREQLAHILGTFPLVFPDDETGQAKKEALLAQYDTWAEQAEGWSDSDLSSQRENLT